MPGRLGQTPEVSTLNVIRIEVSEGDGTEERPVRRVAYFYDQYTHEPLARQDELDPWKEDLERMRQPLDAMGMTPGGTGTPDGINLAGVSESCDCTPARPCTRHARIG